MSETIETHLSILHGKEIVLPLKDALLKMMSEITEGFFMDVYADVSVFTLVTSDYKFMKTLKKFLFDHELSCEATMENFCGFDDAVIIIGKNKLAINFSGIENDINENFAAFYKVRKLFFGEYPTEKSDLIFAFCDDDISVLFEKHDDVDLSGEFGIPLSERKLESAW